MNSKFFLISSPLLILIIISLIVFFIWLGYFLNKMRKEKYPELLSQTQGTIEGSVVGIMSLLLGFTFSFVVSRYEVRRQLIVDEMVNINTAIFRCDLFPDSIRNLLRADLRNYLEARKNYYEDGGDEVRVKEQLKKAKEIAGRIWKIVVTDTNTPGDKLRSQQMVPALGGMFNSIIVRDESRKTGVPPLILWTLLILILITALFLGANLFGKKRMKAFVFGYALILALTLNLIIELNTPRIGLINLNATQEKMNDLMELLK
jgi:FtsH-binding integral membrane protein